MTIPQAGHLQAAQWSCRFLIFLSVQNCRGKRMKKKRTDIVQPQIKLLSTLCSDQEHFITKPPPERIPNLPPAWWWRIGCVWGAPFHPTHVSFWQRINTFWLDPISAVRTQLKQVSELKKAGQRCTSLGQPPLLFHNTVQQHTSWPCQRNCLSLYFLSLCSYNWIKGPAVRCGSLPRMCINKNKPWLLPAGRSNLVYGSNHFILASVYFYVLTSESHSK